MTGKELETHLQKRSKYEAITRDVDLTNDRSATRRSSSVKLSDNDKITAARAKLFE